MGLNPLNEVKSLCKTCTYTTSTWSEDRTAEGYTGCVRLLRCSDQKPLTEEEVANGIIAEVVGFGWVKNGIMCVNDQIVVKAVSLCKFYQKRIS